MSTIRDQFGYPVMNFPWLASLGAYPGIEITRKTGHTNSISNTEALAWPLGTPYTAPTTADVASIAIASTDAEDDISKSGGRVLRIDGLGINHEPIIENVSLTGLTPTPLTNDFLRFNRLRLVSTGSEDVNTGNIHIGTGVFSDNGVPETTYGYVDSGAGADQMAFFTVPASKTALFGMNLMTIEQSRPLETSWIKRDYDNPVKIKFATFEWTVVNNIYADFPIKLEQKTDFWVTYDNGGSQTDAGLIMTFVTFDNGLLDHTTGKF